MTTPYETQTERHETQAEQPPTNESAVANGEHHEADEGSRAHRRSRLLWTTVGAIVLIGLGVGSWLVTRIDTAAGVEVNAGPAATVEVVRETIADTRSFSGTLGFGDVLTITTPGQGVLTRIADQAADVVAGEELFRLDEQPVVAMLGEIPMYRNLELGDSGADVAQLIDNLTDLGFADCQSQDEITGCVQAAIEEWQAELGVDETGVVGLPNVVFVPQEGRVDTIHARVGQAVSPGTPVLDITGSEQIVSFDVELRDRDLLAAGTEAMVQLPGGDQVAGTVTAANVVQDEAGRGDGTDDTIARIEVTLAETVDEAFLGGPADVVVERGEREDVLTVPVNALVAMAEGGHGLEVVADDGTTSIVPVETGLFAGGRVEVSGDGIDEGTVVGVAGR